MKVSCDEGVANHVGPESCGGGREAAAEALTGEVRAGLLSSEILNVRDADAVMSCGRQHRSNRQREGRPDPAESKTPVEGSSFPCTHRPISQGRRSLLFGSREIPGLTLTRVGSVP